MVSPQGGEAPAQFTGSELLMNIIALLAICLNVRASCGMTIDCIQGFDLACNLDAIEKRRLLY